MVLKDWRARCVSGPQLDWFKEDLASHSDYLWKFVVYHKPAFVSVKVGEQPWEPSFEYWVPMFDEYHVDIVFNGHWHGYQRTYPVNWAASENEIHDYSNGTMYITSAGWGGKLFTAESLWYMAYQNMTHNFCVVDVYDNNTLRLQAKDIYGNTIDKVNIYKSPEIKQEPAEETTVETEETETEAEEEKPGFVIPGFPYYSIVLGLVTVTFILWLIQRKR